MRIIKTSVDDITIYNIVMSHSLGWTDTRIAEEYSIEESFVRLLIHDHISPRKRCGRCGEKGTRQRNRG
jgi:hypothetical protein